MEKFFNAEGDPVIGSTPTTNTLVPVVVKESFAKQVTTHLSVLALGVVIGWAIKKYWK